MLIITCLALAGTENAVLTLLSEFLRVQIYLIDQLSLLAAECTRGAKSF